MLADAVDITRPSLHVAAAVGSVTRRHYRAVLALKIVVVLISGLTAWLHQRATTARGRALWGAFTLLSALSALVLGVALAG